jgi:hypothetical protein
VPQLEARLRAMSSETAARYPETLPATWLAQRAAVDPARIDALRRAGELIAVREPGSIEWRYPAWQFENGSPRSGIARVVAVARERGLNDEELYELLTARRGLREGGRTLAELLVEGREDEVVTALRTAR